MYIYTYVYIYIYTQTNNIFCMYCVQYTFKMFPDPLLHSDRCCFVWWSRKSVEHPTESQMIIPQIASYIPGISHKSLQEKTVIPGTISIDQLYPKQFFPNDLSHRFHQLPRSEPGDGPLPAERVPSRLRARPHGQCAVLAGRVWGAGPDRRHHGFHYENALTWKMVSQGSPGISFRSWSFRAGEMCNRSWELLFGFVHIGSAQIPMPTLVDGTLVYQVAHDMRAGGLIRLTIATASLIYLRALIRK